MIDVTEKPDYWQVLRIAGSTQLLYAEQWRRRYSHFCLIPQRTKEAIAMLTMRDDQQRIPGVGTRVSGKQFWLDESPELLKEYEDESKA